MKVGIHTRLRPGAKGPYDEYHRAVWPEVLAAIRRAGITDYVIFRDRLELSAPMMAVAHDYTARASDRLPLIFDLAW